MFRATSTRLAIAALALAPLIAPGAAPSAAAAPLTSAPAAMRTAVPAPPRPDVKLPKTLDVRPKYSPQTRCDPKARPGTRKLGELLVNHYGTGTVGYERKCGRGTSEHYDGRAIDWMVNVKNRNQKAAADAAVQWMSANNGEVARRLGVQYIIWNKKIWGAYAPARGWQNYRGANPHTDHVHISMTWDGANARTSWWSGTAVTKQDMTGMNPVSLSSAPKKAAPKAAAPKAAPKAAAPMVTTPLTKHKNTFLKDGYRGAPVSALQRSLGLRANGRFDARTVKAVKALQKRWKLPQTGQVNTRTWNRAELNAYPWLPYVNQRLEVGAKGPAVSALQRAMGMKATGLFDQRTAAVLRGTKKRLGLPATGITDAKTWQAFVRL